ncbi:carbohydrate ABC transporter permease [Vallitalea guaymasensis]|mgnify:CR=1 FL=1|uniref:Carbohydrate ABC transporter permease n=1 Tax=Vallitalea guaymasensis TaxID=1185412 RepID=A0A8J8ME18_9FIRM|nr:carbohydrate ABC transporter permease [Vallitalea guaymasensis]QUH31334.1 carbohydrate ABC transporter permease [Vallitalea guaymasensis]
MIENKSSQLISKIIIHIILMIFAILCIIPIIAIISISLSNETDIALKGYSLIPRGLTTRAYSIIFKNPKQILNSYLVSITITAVGGALGLLVTSLIAYPLSRKDFIYKKKLTFYVFFTLLFNGGLVPWYIVITRYLHLQNTIWVLILPYIAIPWYILLLRTYFSKIPKSIIESAKIDGSSEFGTFFKIVLPLSKPALATIGLFIILHYWNDWWLSLLYIEKEKLIPLQYMLYRIMNNIQFLTTQMQTGAVTVKVGDLPNESARMAMCIIAAGPMLFLFPFFQKYFVKGLTVGAVKE